MPKGIIKEYGFYTSDPSSVSGETPPIWNPHLKGKDKLMETYDENVSTLKEMFL